MIKHNLYFDQRKSDNLPTLCIFFIYAHMTKHSKLVVLSNHYLRLLILHGIQPIWGCWTASFSRSWEQEFLLNEWICEWQQEKLLLWVKIYCTRTQETTRNNIEQAQECNLKHERLFNTFYFIYHSTFALNWKYVWICSVSPYKAFWSMLLSETEASKSLRATGCPSKFTAQVSFVHCVWGGTRWSKT